MGILESIIKQCDLDSHGKEDEEAGKIDYFSSNEDRSRLSTTCECKA